MDKTGIFFVSLCVVLLGFWFFAQQKEATRLQQQRAQFALTNQVAQTQNPSPTITANATTSNSFSSSTTLFKVASENLIVVSNSVARYTFTSRGGGLKLVELLKFPETISLRWKRNSNETNAVATLNTRADVPVMAILGDTNLIGDGDFTLTKTDDGVRAEKDLPEGLKLVKEFHLSSNYLINASARLENTSGKPLALPAQEIVIGTATPMDADDNGMYLGALWYDGETYADTPVSYFNTNTSFLGTIPRTPKTEFRAGANNVLWAAAQNQFFTLLAMTETNQPAEQVVERPVNLPALLEGSTAPAVGIQTALVYPAQTLAANSTATRQIILYAGPKEFRALSAIGDQFQNRADLAMNFGTGFASFWGVGTFFAKLLLSGMNWLHDVLKISYGWTIVVITLLLRGVFWPLMATSMKSAKKMQALAPEIKALKEKFKDDPQKFTQKQMELWKKNKVNPMSGCLPLVVQMPVFVGFYTMLRSAIELRGAHWLWVQDLSKADTIFLIPGLNFPFNLLPLLMVGAMIWQAHLQPPSPGMDASQQKMMRFMPLLMLLWFYGYASGMALYMTVSTLASAVQAKLTRAAIAAEVTPALTPAPKSKK
ncbi:MAG TPA: membrane protein insertase YidC [Verrucomicrobiae bacterium]|nr:membrane protein insertase YidC [Verrucomicrobiae bacterium]